MFALRMRPVLISSARVAFATLLISLAACPRAARRPQAAELTGLEAPVHREPTLRLVVDGVVSGRSAAVALEIAAPLTTVSSGCLAKPPRSNTTVRVARHDGT